MNEWKKLMETLHIPEHKFTVEEVEEIIKDYDFVPVVRCKDCKWFDRKEGSCLGYCHAIKHAYYSERWEIGIYRQYKEDFYCADGERREDD